MSTSVRDREQRVAGNEGESVPLLSSDALLVEENGLAASVQKRRGVCFRWTLGSLAASLLVGLLLATFLSRKRPPPTPYGTLRSNGTHLFNTTVIMVSIDGLRCAFVGSSLVLRASFATLQSGLPRSRIHTPPFRNQSDWSEGEVYEAHLPCEFATGV